MYIKLLPRGTAGVARQRSLPAQIPIMPRPTFISPLLQQRIFLGGGCSLVVCSEIKKENKKLFLKVHM